MTLTWTELDSVAQKLRETPPGGGAYVTLSAYLTDGREKSVARWDEGTPLEVMQAIRSTLDEQGENGAKKCRIRLWGAGGSPGSSVTCRLDDSPAPSASRQAVSTAPPAPVRQEPVSYATPRHEGAKARRADNPVITPAAVGAGQCPRCRRLEAELRSARQEIRSLNSSNESNVIVVNEEMEKNRRLEKKFAPIQDTLRRAEAERDTLSATNLRLRNRIAELKQQVADLNAELQDAQATNAAWERGVSKLNAMMDDDGDDEDCDDDESWEEDA